MGEKSAETQEGNIPSWLSLLFTENFFAPCHANELLKKRKKGGFKNMLCLNCCSSFCTECPSYSRCYCYSHRLLQIRRCLVQNAVRVDDLVGLINCYSVQSWASNQARVVFINERNDAKGVTHSSPCVTCGRGIPRGCLYCCLRCKFKYLLRTEGGLANFLTDGESLPTQSSSESLPTQSSGELYECALSPDSNQTAATSTPSGTTAIGAAGGTGPTGRTARSDLPRVPRKRRSHVAGGSDLKATTSSPSGPTDTGAVGGTEPIGSAAGSFLSILPPKKRSYIAGGSGRPGPTESGTPSGSDPRGASGLGSTSGSVPRGASGLGDPNGSDHAGSTSGRIRGTEGAVR